MKLTEHCDPNVFGSFGQIADEERRAFWPKAPEPSTIPQRVPMRYLRHDIETRKARAERQAIRGKWWVFDGSSFDKVCPSNPPNREGGK